jgi:hypothetical protein
MRTIMNFVVAGAASAALAGAVPAAAQYPAYGYPNGGYGSPYPGGYGSPYPGGYGSPYPGGYGSPYSGGYGSPYPGGYGQPYPGGYGANAQIAVNRCADAVQERLNGNGYGNAYAYGGGRVLGISSVYPQGYGGAVTVRGVASGGGHAPYAYGSPAPADLTWQCTADTRGVVVGLSIQPAQRTYGHEGYRPAPNGTDDYSQYGYRRY